MSIKHQVRCNLCGKELDQWDLALDFVLRAFIGYGSAHDEERFHARFCCDCTDKFLDSLNAACSIPVLYGPDGAGEVSTHDRNGGGHV